MIGRLWLCQFQSRVSLWCKVFLWQLRFRYVQLPNLSRNLSSENLWLIVPCVFSLQIPNKFDLSLSQGCSLADGQSDIISVMMQAFWERYKFYLSYFPITLGTVTAFVSFEQSSLLTEFTPPTYYSLTALNILLYVLIVLAYVQAIRTKSPLVKEVPFPRIRSQLRNNHPDYACHNRCEKEQDKYKPNRACHSSQDGCVVRFDHYCAITKTAVGHRNHKIHLLLSIYPALLFLQFFIVSICKYRQYTSPEAAQTRLKADMLSESQLSIWMLFTFLSFFITLGLCGLAFSGLKLISKNITYIDLIKGTFTLADRQGTNPNPYDLEAVTNFATLFEGESWRFWLPTPGNIRYDGTKYPMVPPITQAHKKTLFENVQEYLKDPVEKSIPSTFEELYEREYLKYEDAIFHYMGEEYNLEGAIEKPKPAATLPSQNESQAPTEMRQKEAEDILANVYGES